MLPALLQRKLPHETRGTLTTLEDAATATLFGLLRYLPWSLGMGRVLSLVNLPRTDSGIVTFWPRHPGVEPDLLVSGDDWLVLVEAKLGADFGVRQLGREWQLLRALGRQRRLRLVTVSADGFARGSVLERTLRDLADLGDQGVWPTAAQVVSLRWHDLVPHECPQAPHELAIWSDLSSYLSAAGLSRPRFEGWPSVPAEVGTSKSSGLWYDVAVAVRSETWFEIAPPIIPTSSNWYQK